MKLSVISYMKKKSDILNALVFYLTYAIIRTITLLPLRILYVLSDLLYLVLYYFPSYRRKVVAQNLRNSFPEKTEKELTVIGKKFYRHLADLFIETFKLAHMSEKETRKRMTFSNLEVLDKIIAQKRDVAAVLGHYNNWEWTSILSEYTDYVLLPIYKPLQNKYFDGFMNKLRSKFGTTPVPMSNIIREVINARKEKINCIAAFVSDQTPAISSIRYWTTFLNQETPVFIGIEKIASKFDMALVYFEITKVKRGYYNMNVELLLEHTAGLPEYLITETHVKRLEKTIREKPEFWIWSHRRWKHRKPVENA
jgi:Kdo2-lipid IVA lauroyltransferase/acyltransferase